jgi:SAM-dependent methyltransferase
VSEAQFDVYASGYDTALNQGLSLSGESKEFFASARVLWLADRLAEWNARPARVLDFGCGTGGTSPVLLQTLHAREVLGIDPSPDMVAVARRAHDHPRLSFSTIDEMPDDSTFDLAYCNGVFHHIPPAQRAETLARIHASLSVGGYLAFWENNPWNPGTRLVMSRIPFDRDAVLLSPPHARALLRGSGFRVLRTDFLFLFPRLLAFLRPLERRVASIPAGAQYQVLCQKVAWPEAEPRSRRSEADPR